MDKSMRLTSVIPNGVNLRSWLFFIAIFPIISVYLWCCS